MSDEKPDEGNEVEKPNILLIMTDEQYAGMMSCTGNSYLETPALDYLASRGMRFERAYSPNPVCIPSRTSMMTGYYPSAFKINSNGDAKQADIPQDILNNTLGKLFRRAGYQTVFGGKTHWARGLNMETCDFDKLTGDERDELAQEAAGFLRNQTGEPFLLVTSFINPHDICYVELDATAEYYGLPKVYPNSITERETVTEAVRLAEKAKSEGSFDSLCPPLRKNHELTENLPDMLIPKPFKPDEIQSNNVYDYMGDYVRTVWTEEDWRMHHWIYHRLTEDVDRQIGIVLDALQETGLDQNTIVVFLSDHGDMDGSHKKVHKGDLYEESARVPFIVAGPGVVQGVDNKHLISSSVDLIPTLCDFAGIEIPEDVQGRSIKPLAVGKQPKDWRSFVVSENGIGRMVRSDRYKYILYKKGQNREMLFDMKKDSGEMVNLATNPDYRDILAEHRKLLESWVKETGDPVASEYVF